MNPPPNYYVPESRGINKIKMRVLKNSFLGVLNSANIIVNIITTDMCLWWLVVDIIFDPYEWKNREKKKSRIFFVSFRSQDMGNNVLY